MESEMININGDEIEKKIKNLSPSQKVALREYFQMNAKELEDSIHDNLLPSKIFGEFREFSTVGFLKDKLANMPDDLIVYLHVVGGFNTTLDGFYYRDNKISDGSYNPKAVHCFPATITSEERKDKLRKILNM